MLKFLHAPLGVGCSI